jgi:23S rRNA (uracil1939-C5)-methyltransferase
MCRLPEGWTPEKTRGFILVEAKFLSYAMPESETIRPLVSGHDLHIEKWVYGGRGLGRLEGRAVLVPFVLPGEVVRVELERERPGLLEAKLSAVVTASPQRTQPPCPYFGRCGGCHYQHATYEAQLARKVEVLREVFQRVGKQEAPGEIDVISASPWEYRNRAQFHVAGGEAGYLEAGSNRLCPVGRCPICSPAINQALATLRGMIRDNRFPRFVRSVELFTNESEVQLNVLEADRLVAKRFFEWCAEGMPGAAAGSLDYRAAGQDYRVSHRSFFQVNRFLIDNMVERALEGAEGETAVDLYAGVGLFSLPLARRFQSVTAVESVGGAVRDLEFNASRASLAVKAVRATAEEYLRDADRPPDFLLADPPRAGLGKAVVQDLVRLRPGRLTILSCDPATLARDLGPLTAAGYRTERVTLIDLFPQTYHIETVVNLRLG